MRFSLNESRQESPAFLLYGRDPNLQIDLELNIPKKNSIHSITQQLLPTDSKKEKAKQHYDSKHEVANFKIGDLVWITNPTLNTGTTPKFSKLWKGPYRVIERTNNLNFTLVHFNNPL
jgi:hypothetical protein